MGAAEDGSDIGGYTIGELGRSGTQNAKEVDRQGLRQCELALRERENLIA